MSMRKMAGMAAVLTLVAAAGSAQASLVAAWNFNNSTANSTSGQLGVLNSTAADWGSGTLSVGPAPTVTFNTVTAGSADGLVGVFAGTTNNAVTGDPAGNSLVLQAGLAGAGSVIGNGGYFQFQISMTGLDSLIVSFSTRGTSTGFSSDQLSYSTDGSIFTDFGPTWSGTSTTFATVTRDLSSVTALNNQANVYIRMTFNGATGASGNNRVDNVQFNAAPAPGAMALLGLGGLLAARRRRA